MTDQQPNELKTLYRITGNVADINTILINRGELSGLRADLERVSMQLAACGVVAMSDTLDSAKKARTMHPDYESPSCDDVKRRVDECIELRARVTGLEAQLESIGAGGVGPLMQRTHCEHRLNMVTLPHSVVEQELAALIDKCIATYAIHGTNDYMIVDDGKARNELLTTIRAALEQPPESTAPYLPDQMVYPLGRLMGDEIARVKADPQAEQEPRTQLTDDERTELLDWVSACQSAYSMEKNPRSPFFALPGQLQENRESLVDCVNEILEARCPQPPVVEHSQGEQELVAFMHDVVASDGEPDQALSFSKDNFPLEGLGGFRSVGVRPLTYLQPKREPQFDAFSFDQERLAVQFCAEIAGLLGGEPSPPDPVRLLEMAEALYRAEMQEISALHQQPQRKPLTAARIDELIEEGVFGCNPHELVRRLEEERGVFKTRPLTDEPLLKPS